MSLSFDPVRPYLPVVAMGLIVAVLFGGCSWGKSIQRTKSAETITGLQSDLRAARDALTAAGQALRAQSADLIRAPLRCRCAAPIGLQNRRD